MEGRPAAAGQFHIKICVQIARSNLVELNSLPCLTLRDLVDCDRDLRCWPTLSR